MRAIRQVGTAQTSSRPHPSGVRRKWLWLFLALLTATITGSGAVLAQAPLSTVGVYYVGAEDAVAEAINLAAPYLVRVDQPELAQVLVLNNFLPRAGETVRLFATLVQRGDVGLVIFCGSQFPKTSEDLRAVFGVGAFGITNAESALPVRIGSEADPLQRAITWASAPPIQARTVISNANLLLPIVTTTAREPLIQRVRGREGTQAFIVGGWFGDPANQEWQHWPYFRYLIYRLIVEAANSSRVLPFAGYPLSPVPQGRVRLGMIGAGGAVIFLAFWTLYLARRRLFMHPEIWKDLRTTPPSQPQQNLWEIAGFHRPLAGLLTLLLPYFLALGLLIAYQVDYLPRVLIPWTHTLRLWQVTEVGFSALWLLVDLGTGVAAVYYFATLRIRYPHEAFRYFQFYVWWQWLSGAVQLGSVLLVTTLVLPGAPLAYLAFYFVAHALIQFPGFFQGFRFFFRAVQRLDYEQYLAVLAIISMVGVQSATVLLLRQWGTKFPIIGETLGSILGLGIGVYLTELLGFVLGLLLYKSLGYSLRAFFLPTFSRQVIAQMLSFGGRLTFGAIFVPLGALAQVFLLPQWLPTYNAVERHWTLALAFAAAYEVLATGLYDGLLPAMAEAHSQGYKTLLRYYISQAIHYGVWLSLFLFVALSAVGSRVISGMAGAAFSDVPPWLLPVLLWGGLQWGAWFTNQVLIATNHPAATSWLTIAEQGVRLGLTAFFVPRWGMVGLPVAFAIALILRIIVAWYLVYRHAGRMYIYVWRTIVAPAVAAWAVYVILRLVGNWWWTPTLSASLVLLGVALLPMLALYGFITALLGGWDDDGIAELQRATGMSSIGFPLAWLLLFGVRAGARLSPLHGRFPVALRALAEEEAQALTLGQTALGRAALK
ncbi:MAG TPA: oligosaccharide flippase family protein [Anaerolineae bacterium]|nr:oligosaccharide flippase family protein [Anaerolineae bacterium]HQK15431.1 oligosaccharide flippase family protein [Anaerolineae bacterium]